MWSDLVFQAVDTGTIYWCIHFESMYDDSYLSTGQPKQERSTGNVTETK